MTESSDELGMLTPPAHEIALNVGALVHVILLAVVVVLVLRRKLEVPYSIFGYFVLLMPLIGPLLVIQWNLRHRAFLAKREEALLQR